MTTLSPFISGMMLIAALIHIFLGSYALYIDSRSKLNRIFFMTTVALFIWGFAFSLAIVAPKASIVLFWRRLASLGWGTFYALMVHFIIVLTQQKGGRTSQLGRAKYLLGFILYVPAIVSFYVFGFSTELAAQNYNLVYTYFGWRNESVHSIWDSLFNGYFISYSLVGLAMLTGWRRKTQFLREKKQSSLIIVTLIFAFVAGTITDIILDYFLGVTLPEMGIVFLVIPTVAIWVSIRRYSFMAIGPAQIAGDIVKNVGEGLILTNAYGEVQMVNPAAESIFESKEAQLLSRPIGSLIRHEFLPQERGLLSDQACHIKQLELNIKTMTGIERPIILTSSLIKDGFDELIGMVCILSDQTEIHKREQQLQQVKSQLELTVEERTKSLRKLNELQNIVIEISTEFITLSEQNMAEKVEYMLQNLGSHIKADRVSIFKLDKDVGEMRLYKVWQPKQTPPIARGEGFPEIFNFIEGYRLFKLQKYYYALNVSTIPKDEYGVVELLRNRGTKSLLAMPLEIKMEMAGLITFETFDKKANWDKHQINLLGLIATILSDGILRIETERDINRLAYFDHLTGLPNRAQFIKQLEKRMVLSDELVMLFIDLDNFKVINDSMGHTIGDQVLKQMAERLEHLVNPFGFISRIGGDEFIACLYRYAHVSEIEALVMRVHESFKEPITLHNDSYLMSASIGVSYYPKDGQTPEALIANADRAMYVAKESGRNAVQVCSEKIKDEMKYRNQLINYLHQAIQNGEMAVYYQPQVYTKTGQIEGMEALVRWFSPQLGTVSPAEFIPLAERHGMINQIGQWVLEQVCMQVRDWLDKGLYVGKVGVNVSIQQLKEPDFVQRVKETLATFELDASYLEFEVTESVAMTESYRVMETLQAIKNLGVEIAIDDFGSDYSSLRRLKKLPIDRIKIDKEFISDISKESKNHAILKAIILLAEHLQLKLIAEGVETIEQVDLLTEYRCYFVQGYYYFKPMAAAACEMVLNPRK